MGLFLTSFVFLAVLPISFTVVGSSHTCHHRVQS